MAPDDIFRVDDIFRLQPAYLKDGQPGDHLPELHEEERGRPGARARNLYLNVFRPQGSWSRRLPVTVWVHGGTLLVGESDNFKPAGLVRHGVIVVTINYRIGALGFLADPALAGRPVARQETTG